MRRIGLVRLTLGVLALGGVGVIAYQLGLAAGATSAVVADGATVVVGMPWGVGPGFFPVIGLLFFGLLFLAIVGGIGGRTAWARGGPGPWATDPDRPVPPFVQERLARWHAAAHGTTSTASTSTHPADPA